MKKDEKKFRYKFLNKGKYLERNLYRMQQV